MLNLHKKILLTWTLIMQATHILAAPQGILYPKESETREIVSLDGIWNFVVPSISDPHVGYSHHWYKDNLSKLKGVEHHLMPVPSSYNDITQNSTIRDHVGVVWYDRTFFVPKSWIKKRVFLRFSSVSYMAQVWINGEIATAHEIGHLPFLKEVGHMLAFGGRNRITVACDNTLQQDTIPEGRVEYVSTDQGRKPIQSYTFDFFNYAGIHRPVTLYTTPWSYIDDICVDTKIIGTTGMVYFNITFVSTVQDLKCHVALIDKEGKVVDKVLSLGFGVLVVPHAKFWWPYLMSPNPGYLYTLQVELKTAKGETMDIYRLPVGIRTLSWTKSSVLLNDRPLYLHGFGRHEDGDIRGKGLDLVTVVKDHNLIKWVGANAYRTSHYPYAEEIMDMADRLGIMIIDECPSADTNAFTARLLQKHKNSLTELIKRDKNRPSVIMWSLANEPTTDNFVAGAYFGEVAKHVRSIDSTRPITVAISKAVDKDRIGKHLDVISFNRYNSWYSNSGRLDLIIEQVIGEATAWHLKYNKPVILSEYGADTFEGLHVSPQYVWSEEFQVSMMSKHFKAFDRLRAQGWFIGEFIWNFADFKTAQSVTRVGGNKKGIFTRSRQPKAGAHHLRKRYFHLAKELYNATLPEDLHEYIAPISNYRDEL